MFTPDHRSGQTLGNWELLWRIGQGAQAVVYRAQNPAGLNAAVKLATQELHGERIAEEGRTLSRLTHPGLPTYIESLPGGFAMELVQGTHLGGAKLPPDKAAALVAQVADTVDYLHTQGLAHRDLKPENILVNAQGRARLIDLGGVGPALQAGASVHTPGFVPPEARPVGQDMDRFALGRILESVIEGPPSAELSALISELTHADPSLRPEASQVRERLTPLATEVGPMVAATLAESAAQTRLTAGPFGRYELKRLRGRGAMGEVWQAFDTVLRRDVALKVTRGDPARFAREARAIATLDHPRLVRLLDFGADQGRLYMAMDLVDGPSLEARLEQGPLPEDTLLQIALEISEGLAAVHRAGLLHRDLKPANILLSEQGARLADFGLVSSADGTHLTQDGTRLGTPAYMSPEQARAEALTPAADVYGLGAVLFRAVQGTPPHSAPDAVQTLALVTEGGAPPLRAGSPDLQRVVARCLRDHPEDRYADAAALNAALRRLQAGERIETGSLRPWLRRHGPTVGVAVGLLALVLGIGRVSQLRAQAAERARVDQVTSLEEQVQSLWAQDPDAAREMLAQGLSEPELQQTQLAADAWTRHAAREQGAQRLDALSNAYFQAPDPREALAHLAEAMEEDGQAGSALAAGWILHEMGPSGPTQTPWASAALVSLGRSDAASGPLADAVQALSLTVPIPATELKASGSGWVVSAEGLQSLRVEEDAVLLGAAQQGLNGTAFKLFPEGVVGDVDRGNNTLLSLQGEPIATLWGEANRSAHYVDIDGDGDREFVSAGTGESGIQAWNWGDTAPRRLSEPLAGEHADLVVLDMDADGRVELARPSGAWGGMDVRIYQGGATGTLPLRTRLPLGHIVHMEGLPDPDGDRLLIAKSRLFGSREVFPSGNPEGLAPGVHMLTLVDGRLSVERTLLDQEGCTAIHSGDVDGDGQEEIAAQCGQDLLLVARREGQWHHARLQGITGLLNPMDVDGDGDAELIAQIDGVWHALGAGKTPLRALPPPQSTQVQDPKVKRAVQLAEVGLHAQALQRLALLENQQERAFEAAFHRARILAELGRGAEAEAAWALAAQDPARRAEVARLAMEAAWRDARMGDASRHLEALLQTPVPDRDALEAQALDWSQANPQYTEIRFDGPIPDQLELLWPAVLDETGLHVEAAQNQQILRLPLEDLRGPVRVEMDLRIERMEWSGGVGLRLHDAQGRLVSAALRAIGGSGLVSTELSCVAGVSGPRPRIPQPSATPELGGTLSLRTRQGEGACAHTAVGNAVIPNSRDAQGSGSVAVGLIGYEGLSTRVTLKGLRIYGAELAEGPGTPEAWAFARGERVSEQADPLLRILDLDRRGEGAEAEALLRAQSTWPWLADLLRMDGLRWMGPVATFKADALGYYITNMATAIAHHSPDPELDALVARDLPELLETEHPDPELLALALRARGAALRRQGQTTAAKAHLLRAWALQPNDLYTARELAILHLNAQDKEQAMTWALRGLGGSHGTLGADHLSVHPELVGLHAHPDWSQIEAARLFDGPLVDDPAHR